MKKIMLVFGTRPEAIKMCPVINELKKRKVFEICICVTGQHKEMLKQVLDIFNIVPDYNLKIMKKSQTLFDITEKVLRGMKEILIKETPDLLLVHGDTTTTFASALAAFYLDIPVGHIEAGLRTYNINSPFPEEFNRQAVSVLSQVNFAPTEWARQNLIREGKAKDSIYVTGNTVIDALKTTISNNYYHSELDWAKDSRMVLLTAHRRENQGETMKSMFKAIRKVVDAHSDIKLIYPVHLNPAIRNDAYEILGGSNRIHIIEPLEVIDFHNFLSKCYMVLTDSGGIQEEASAIGKPVLVLRNTTERPEGVNAGVLKLVGTKFEDIYKEFSELLDNDKIYKKMSNKASPYGAGHASEKICRILEQAI